MRDRRSFFRTLALGFVALAVVVGPAIADEILGVITKVDVDAKKLTVVGEDDKEVTITTNDDTELVTKKGSRKARQEDPGQREEGAPRQDHPREERRLED